MKRGHMPDDLDRVVDEIQEAIIEDARMNYSEKVVELWLNPRNIGPMDEPDGMGKVTGPCGDTMQIFLRIKEGRIIKATFLTDGCGPTVAAGSMATELAIEKKIEEAEKITQEMVLEALHGLPDESLHCALLASDTLKQAINHYEKIHRGQYHGSTGKDDDVL